MALRIEPKAVKDAKGMPRQDWDRLKERLERIARNPRGTVVRTSSLSKTATGSGPGIGARSTSSRRGGDVKVIKVGTGREVYRRQ